MILLLIIENGFIDMLLLIFVFGEIIVVEWIMLLFFFYCIYEFCVISFFVIYIGYIFKFLDVMVFFY